MIPGNKITIIDPFPEYLSYPFQKLHLTGYCNILKSIYLLQHVLPGIYQKVQEINEIYPEKNILISDNISIYDDLVVGFGVNTVSGTMPVTYLKAGSVSLGNIQRQVTFPWVYQNTATRTVYVVANIFYTNGNRANIYCLAGSYCTCTRIA